MGGNGFDKTTRYLRTEIGILRIEEKREAKVPGNNKF